MTDTKDLQYITLGGGCFWCLDAGFRLINGVTSVVSGYAGGDGEASYYEVSGGKTGHAEVVRVGFDTSVIALKDILDIFWAMHNPTTLNFQGNDHGPQYRSIILYENDLQRPVIDESIQHVAKLWDDPIVTEVVRLTKFYEAEQEHQDYFQKHPEAAYCQVIINPKLAKLRAKFQAKLR